MFFVYRITNKRLSKHYYGSRHAKHATLESLGTTYFSSSKNADFIEDQKKNPQDYKYKIIKIFKTKNESIRYESMLHAKFNVGTSTKFYNGSEQTESSVKFFGEKTCEYCDSVVTVGNYSRWHGDKCRVLDKTKTFDQRMKYFPYMKLLRNTHTMNLEWINTKFFLYNEKLYSKDLKTKRTKIKSENGNITINTINFDSSIHQHVNAKEWVLIDNSDKIILKNFNIDNLLKDLPKNCLYGTYSMKCSLTFLHERAQLNHAISNGLLKYEGFKVMTLDDYNNGKIHIFNKNRINKILTGRNNYKFNIYNSTHNIIKEIPSIIFKELYDLKLPFEHICEKIVTFNDKHSSFKNIVSKGYDNYIGWKSEKIDITEQDIYFIETVVKEKYG